MTTIWRAILVFTGLVLSTLPSHAAEAEKRIALVIGNAAYAAGALPTPANDAGLIAQTLQAAGFDVVGARDLDGESLRRAFHDFLDKASASGPGTVAFVYLAGYGLQFQGENYFAPVDARLAHAADVPVEAVRLSDYTRSLAGLGLKASVFVLDAARASPFLKSDPQPLAGGLALVDPDPGMLIAFNAAPGTIGPPETGPYGAYAKALAEMLRQGGLALPDVFAQTRLRVGEATKGAELPWDAAKLSAPVSLFDRAPDAPPPPQAYQDAPRLRSQPIRSFTPADAYAAAVARDTFQGYEDFLVAFPDDPMAARVRAILAARREAITWRRTWLADSPQAYWSYLDRYPRGPHAWDARRRLRELSAAFAPPPTFTAIAYDVPPPPPDEIVYCERPVLFFDDPVWRLPPPPPPPIIFLPPPVIIVLAPPPPPIIAYVLPVPVFVPVPRWVVPPRYVVPPPGNELFRNIHERIDVGGPGAAHLTAGQVVGGVAAVGAGAALLRVALPPSIARKAPPANLVNGKPVPGGPVQGFKPLPGAPLPGAQPLPGKDRLLPQEVLKPGPGAPDLKRLQGQNQVTPDLKRLQEGQPGQPLAGNPATLETKPPKGRPRKPDHELGQAADRTLPATGTPPAADRLRKDTRVQKETRLPKVTTPRETRDKPVLVPRTTPDLRTERQVRPPRETVRPSRPPTIRPEIRRPRCERPPCR
ncbi:caspase family protein [Labrys wisconsinensis]|uniref:Caspase-like protein n=1 Tax=Labrys wisconsinensis TaxID=425677 RepID=A0ABU0JBS7_9HYPH|nr:caspase family protein [Labrys wisconsinensis]MDQ0471724.1 putative caspase-like protein [Labrys wisconsinensis]